MDNNTKWAVGLMFGAAVTVGSVVIGAGVSGDPIDRGLVVVGVWIVAVAVWVVLPITVVWPFVMWMLGPVYDFMHGLSSGSTRKTAGLTIVRAKYHDVDITSELQSLVRDGCLDILCMPVPLGVTDPAEGVPKRLKVEYVANGKESIERFKDGDRVRLPPP